MGTKNNCIRCHTASPWVRTPIISKTRLPNGERLVPPPSKKERYVVVASDYHAWAGGYDVSMWQPSHLDLQNQCTSCHRVAPSSLSETVVENSMGVYSADVHSLSEALSPFFDLPGLPSAAWVHGVLHENQPKLGQLFGWKPSCF